MVSRDVKFHQYWIYGLTIAWLIATFEHNYFTLSKYSHNLIFMGINISNMANILLVLALDLSVFWSVKFIPQARVWDVNIKGAQTVLVLSTLFSILLNIRYMVTAAPSNGFLDIMIAIITGIIIPSYVAIFGWIEGNVSLKRVDSSTENTTNKNKALEIDNLAQYMADNPKASRRQLAEYFNVSQATIQNKLNEYRASKE